MASTYDFDYARATSVDEALSMMESGDGNAKLLAGGHSLLPTMKLRLSSPAKLIDVSGIKDLSGIEESGGRLHVGAMTTHRTVEMSSLVKEKCNALAEIASGIGDPMVRNRGTIGGSLAHADPSADYPAFVMALDADIEVASRTGTRTVAADDFFQDMFETALEENEMITKVSFPVLGNGKGAYYAKYANPASRYAIVGVAAMLEMNGDTCSAARIAVTGASSVAFRATSVEQNLTGQSIDEAMVKKAVQGMVDPGDLLSELSGSAEYRAHLCEVMARKAILTAAERAHA